MSGIIGASRAGGGRIQGLTIPIGLQTISDLRI